MFSALFPIFRRKFLTPMVLSGCLAFARVRAKPHVLAASEIKRASSGDVMVTSKAAGCPAIKLRKYTPSGLELFSGRRIFCSHTGERLADEQAAIVSRTLS